MIEDLFPSPCFLPPTPSSSPSSSPYPSASPSPAHRKAHSESAVDCRLFDDRAETESLSPSENSPLSGCSPPRTLLEAASSVSSPRRPDENVPSANVSFPDSAGGSEKALVNIFAHNTNLGASEDSASAPEQSKPISDPSPRNQRYREHQHSARECGGSSSTLPERNNFAAGTRGKQQDGVCGAASATVSRSVLPWGAKETLKNQCLSFRTANKSHDISGQRKSLTGSSSPAATQLEIHIDVLQTTDLVESATKDGFGSNATGQGSQELSGVSRTSGAQRLEPSPVSDSSSQPEGIPCGGESQTSKGPSGSNAVSRNAGRRQERSTGVGESTQAKTGNQQRGNSQTDAVSSKVPSPADCGGNDRDNEKPLNGAAEHASKEGESSAPVLVLSSDASLRIQEARKFFMNACRPSGGRSRDSGGGKTRSLSERLGPGQLKKPGDEAVGEDVERTQRKNSDSAAGAGRHLLTRGCRDSGNGQPDLEAGTRRSPGTSEKSGADLSSQPQARRSSNTWRNKTARRGEAAEASKSSHRRRHTEASCALPFASQSSFTPEAPNGIAPPVAGVPSPSLSDLALSSSSLPFSTFLGDLRQLRGVCYAAAQEDQLRPIMSLSRKSTSSGRPSSARRHRRSRCVSAASAAPSPRQDYGDQFSAAQSPPSDSPIQCRFSTSVSLSPSREPAADSKGDKAAGTVSFTAAGESFETARGTDTACEKGATLAVDLMAQDSVFVEADFPTSQRQGLRPTRATPDAVIEGAFLSQEDNFFGERHEAEGREPLGESMERRGKEYEGTRKEEIERTTERTSTADVASSSRPAMLKGGADGVDRSVVDAPISKDSSSFNSLEELSSAQDGDRQVELREHSREKESTALPDSRRVSDQCHSPPKTGPFASRQETGDSALAPRPSHRRRGDAVDAHLSSGNRVQIQGETEKEACRHAETSVSSEPRAVASATSETQESGTTASLPAPVDVPGDVPSRSEALNPKPSFDPSGASRSVPVPNPMLVPRAVEPREEAFEGLATSSSVPECSKSGKLSEIESGDEGEVSDAPTTACVVPFAPREEGANPLSSAASSNGTLGANDREEREAREASPSPAERGERAGSPSSSLKTTERKNDVPSVASGTVSGLSGSPVFSHTRKRQSEEENGGEETVSAAAAEEQRMRRCRQEGREVQAGEGVDPAEARERVDVPQKPSHSLTIPDSCFSQRHAEEKSDCAQENREERQERSLCRTSVVIPLPPAPPPPSPARSKLSVGTAKEPHLGHATSVSSFPCSSCGEKAAPDFQVSSLPPPLVCPEPSSSPFRPGGSASYSESPQPSEGCASQSLGVDRSSLFSQSVASFSGDLVTSRDTQGDGHEHSQEDSLSCSNPSSCRSVSSSSSSVCLFAGAAAPPPLRAPTRIVCASESAALRGRGTTLREGNAPSPPCSPSKPPRWNQQTARDGDAGREEGGRDACGAETREDVSPEFSQGPRRGEKRKLSVDKSHEAGLSRPQSSVEGSPVSCRHWLPSGSSATPSPLGRRESFFIAVPVPVKRPGGEVHSSEDENRSEGECETLGYGEARKSVAPSRRSRGPAWEGTGRGEAEFAAVAFPSTENEQTSHKAVSSLLDCTSVTVSSSSPPCAFSLPHSSLPVPRVSSQASVDGWAGREPPCGFRNSSERGSVEISGRKGFERISAGRETVETGQTGSRFPFHREMKEQKEHTRMAEQKGREEGLASSSDRSSAPHSPKKLVPSPQMSSSDLASSSASGSASASDLAFSSSSSGMRSCVSPLSRVGRKQPFCISLLQRGQSWLHRMRDRVGRVSLTKVDGVWSGWRAKVADFATRVTAKAVESLLDEETKGDLALVLPPAFIDLPNVASARLGARVIFCDGRRQGSPQSCMRLLHASEREARGYFDSGKRVSLMLTAGEEYTDTCIVRFAAPAIVHGVEFVQGRRQGAETKISLDAASLLAQDVDEQSLWGCLESSLWNPAISGEVLPAGEERVAFALDTGSAPVTHLRISQHFVAPIRSDLREQEIPENGAGFVEDEAFAGLSHIRVYGEFWREAWEVLPPVQGSREEEVSNLLKGAAVVAWEEAEKPASSRKKRRRVEELEGTERGDERQAVLLKRRSCALDRQESQNETTSAQPRGYENGEGDEFSGQTDLRWRDVRTVVVCLSTRAAVSRLEVVCRPTEEEPRGEAWNLNEETGSLRPSAGCEPSESRYPQEKNCLGSPTLSVELWDAASCPETSGMNLLQQRRFFRCRQTSLSPTWTSFVSSSASSKKWRNGDSPVGRVNVTGAQKEVKGWVKTVLVAERGSHRCLSPSNCEESMEEDEAEKPGDATHKTNQVMCTHVRLRFSGAVDIQSLRIWGIP
ncbi:hypothetical protein TGMAS_258450 [Toxoplasma gondii MAS]|uniref:Uncharacterized protein n=1 Tax=Toxoplasma gondii MAS TaxID=943118 RepID=A0A086QKX5_TOXGO|nr:hypothetical protein TGMAS_258450 [Toxoplasma gondii MAS]